MQLLSSNSISIPFFLPRECLMPDIETGIVAVVFTQICHPAHQLFTLFITFDISSSSFRTKSFRTPLPPVTPQIIPLPVWVNVNIVCDVQGLSSTLNLIQSHGCSWKLLVALTQRQQGSKTLVSFHCPCWTTCQAADEQHQQRKVIGF